MPSEKDLDRAIDDAFKNDPKFSQWFLSKTKFADQDAKYFWSRSDNPWGKISTTVTNKDTGLKEVIKRDSETDILVVFETSFGNRFALHIENKLGDGRFTPNQPELYVARATAWLENEKYKSYTDFETVLIAPKIFYERNLSDAQQYGCYVSHEEIAELLPIFTMQQSH